MCQSCPCSTMCTSRSDLQKNFLGKHCVAAEKGENGETRIGWVSQGWGKGAWGEHCEVGKLPPAPTKLSPLCACVLWVIFSACNIPHSNLSLRKVIAKKTPPPGDFSPSSHHILAPQISCITAQTKCAFKKKEKKTPHIAIFLWKRITNMRITPQPRLSGNSLGLGGGLLTRPLRGGRATSVHRQWSVCSPLRSTALLGVTAAIADSLNNCSTWRYMECSVTLIISHFFPQMEWSASCAYGSSLKDVGALGWSLQDVLSLTHVHLFVSEFKMWYIWVRKTRFLCRLLLFQLRSKRCRNTLFEQTCSEAGGFL